MMPFHQSCHGADAAGRTSGLGVTGVDIRCADVSLFVDHVRNGEGKMRRFRCSATPTPRRSTTGCSASFCPLAP